MSFSQLKIGDIVYIDYGGKIFTTEIISKVGLQLILFDRENSNITTLMWTDKWVLFGGIKPTAVYFKFAE